MPSWNLNFELYVDRTDPQMLEYVAATRSLSRTIRDIPVPPHVQHRLHTLNIVRAVRGTTGIEGTEVSESEVSEVLNAPEGQRVLQATRQREEREVRNASALMTFVDDELRREPGRRLTESLVREFHRVLTSGIDYEHNDPGRYRSLAVTAGDYQTPSPDEVPDLMARFFDWLNQGLGRELDPIVQVIVAHFLLISIHPFGDGNGRTSRGVESFLLYRAGINVRGFYSLANYYYRNRSEYVDLLNHVRFVSDPDVGPFVEFALRGLVEELEQVHAELISEIRTISFRDFAREQLQLSGRLGTRTGNRQLLFLFALGDRDVTLSDVVDRLHPVARLYRGVGRKTVTRDLNVLKSLDLITVENGVIKANTGVMDQFAVTS